MSFILAIGDSLGVSVEGEYTDKTGVIKKYSFVLECKRLGADEMIALQADTTRTIPAFFADVATGWRGQMLVMNEGGGPAEFSQAALGALMGIAGMPMQCYQAYSSQVGVRQKNSLTPRG